MKPEEAKRILEYHQKWRKGAEVEPTDIKKLSEAIDVAIEVIEENERLKQIISGFFDEKESMDKEIESLNSKIQSYTNSGLMMYAEIESMKGKLKEYEESDFAFNDSQMIVTYIPTGNVIMGKGFKKSSGNRTAKLKSLAGATHVFIEEAEENAEADFRQLDDILRTVKQQ